MPAILLTGPAVEPLTLDEAKAYLRVTIADDDAIISALIASARLCVEAYTRRALISQNWRVIRDAWPADGQLHVLPAPLQAVTAARVYDENGNAQAIDVEAFVIDTASAPARLAFPPWSVPAPGRTTGGIELDVTLGYGPAATDVPAPLVLAIRKLVAHGYENRGASAAGATLPAGIAALIAPYRVLSL